MAALNIRIESGLLGTTEKFDGAIANLFPLKETNEVLPELPKDILIPAGRNSEVEPVMLEVPEGDYVLQVRYPNGEIDNRRVRIRQNKVESVILSPDMGSSGWLSWQSFIGDVPTSKQQERSETVETTPPSSEYDSVEISRDEILRNLASESGSIPDNLTRIHGIGPKISDQLKSIGIFKFEQLANVSPKEMDTIEKLTRRSRNAVEYHWVQGARRLSLEKHGLSEIDTTTMRRKDLRQALEAPSCLIIVPIGANIKLSTALYEKLSRVFSFAQSEGRSLIELSRYIFGNEASVCAPDVEGDGSGSEIQRVLSEDKRWKWEINDPSSLSCIRSISNEQVVRDIYILGSRKGVQSLSKFPFPWRAPGKHGFAGIDVTYDWSHGERFSILPRDALIAPLLGFLRAGDMNASRAIMRDARHRLLEKVDNPYAAAAGAHVLVNDFRWGRKVVDQSADWLQWIENLMNWFEWMPDGKILSAWTKILAFPNKLEEARDALLSASLSGLPVYTRNFQLLIDGLKMFRDHFEENNDEQIKGAINRLERTSLRVDPHQIFTTVQITRAELLSGEIE